jgi:signal peptidase I
MRPTLVQGDQVQACTDRTIEHRTVVLYRRPATELNLDKYPNGIARIVALPGDRLRVTDINEVLINGAEVGFARVFLLDFITPDFEACVAADCIVPDGSMFIAGDDSNGSRDSRVFGYMDLDAIIGVIDT